MLSRKISLLNSKAVSQNGLIGYWSYLKGFSSTRWDNVAPAKLGSFNAAIVGAVLQSDSVYFNGIEAKATIPPLLFSGDFSMEFYFKYTTGNGYNNIISDSTDTSRKFGLNNANDSLRIFIGGYSFDFPTIKFYSGDSLFTMISIRYNSATKTVDAFQNGVYKSSATNANSVANFNTISIIIGGLSTYYTIENVKSFKMYNRMITNDEVTQNYDARDVLGV